MTEKDTIAAIHANPGHPDSRCLDTARGRTVLERVAAATADVPRVATVAVLTPTPGQAMSLGRAFKNKIHAAFLSYRGGRAATTCKALLQQHDARFLLSLDGDNLLCTRALMRRVLDEAATQDQPCLFDPAVHVPGVQSMFASVCAAPADHVRRAAALRENTDIEPARRIQHMLAVAGAAPLALQPGPDEFAELVKLDFDNRLFSCRSLAVETVASGRFMDAGLFESVCDEIAGLGRAFNIVFGHGGDPLLHPDIFSFIRTAASRGLGIGLRTGGLLLNELRTRAVCEAGLDTLAVDLDAVDDDTYFDLHRMPLTPVENNVLRALDIRKECGAKTAVAVRFTMNDINRREAGRFYEKWRRVADRVVFREAADANGRLANRAALHAPPVRNACERPLRRPVLTCGGDVLMCHVAGAEKFLNCGSVLERGVLGAFTHAGARTIYGKKPVAARGAPCSACDLWRFESSTDYVTRAAVARFDNPSQGDL